MDLNKAMIIGNMTNDPEMRTTPNGISVCSFSLATNLVWTDTNGQKQTKVEYHNIVLWRKLAEIATQYLKKGNKVYIEGRIETRSWEDQNGMKRYKTEIVGDNMIMLSGPRGAGEGHVATAPKYEAPSAQEDSFKSQPTVDSIINQTQEQEIKLEDIPF